MKNKLTSVLLDKSVTLVKKDDFHYVQYSHTSRRETPDVKTSDSESEMGSSCDLQQ